MFAALTVVLGIPLSELAGRRGVQGIARVRKAKREAMWTCTVPGVVGSAIISAVGSVCWFKNQLQL